MSRNKHNLKEVVRIAPRPKLKNFCLNSRPKDELERKSSKNNNMRCELLYNQGIQLDFVPLMLGTQASVCTCFIKAMNMLGMSSSDQLTIAKTLAEQAYTSLHFIVRSRFLWKKVKKPMDRLQECHQYRHSAGNQRMRGEAYKSAEGR